MKSVRVIFFFKLPYFVYYSLRRIDTIKSIITAKLTVRTVYTKIVPAYNLRRNIACACKFTQLVNASSRRLADTRELSRNVLSNFKPSSHGYRGRNVSFQRFSTLVKI